MEFHFSSNRAEAERWLSTAVKLLTTRDLQGTKSFAIRARESDPRLEAAEQIIAVADTLLAGDMRINNYQQPDWYAILQLAQYTQNLELVATQYRRLALLLNPHRNRFPYADQAFRLVSEAWNILSNPSKKALYDNELSMYSRFDSAPSSGSTQLFERQFLQMHHVQQQQQQPPPQQQPPHFQLQQHFYQPPPPPQQDVQRPQFHLQQPPQQQQKEQNLQFLEQPQQQFLRPPQQEEQPQPQFLRRPQQQDEQSKQPSQPQFLGRGPQQLEEQQQQQFMRPPQQQQFPRPPPQQLEEQHQFMRPPQEEEQQPPQQQQQPAEEEEEEEGHQQPARKTPKRKDGRSAIANNVTESTHPPAPSESIAPCESTKLVSVSESGNFWTACPYCYNLYEYPKVYEECMLRCQNCKRGFSAVVIKSPPVIGTDNVVNFCCWGYFPLGFEDKGKATQGSAGWTPFSTMFACPVQGKKNKKQNVGQVSSGPRVYYDDDEALIDISDPSEDSDDDDDEWEKSERKKRAVKAKAKAPGPKNRAKTPVRSSSRINKGNQSGSVQDKVGSGATLGGDSVPKASKAEPSKKASASRKRGAAELGKLDLNVEFSNNEGEEHAAQTVSARNGTANGPEDNIEGIGFFEGLDEFLSSLPILNVVADDKVKAN